MFVNAKHLRFHQQHLWFHQVQGNAWFELGRYGCWRSWGVSFAGRYGQLGEIGVTPTRSWKNALYKCLKHLETTSTFLICIMVTNGSCNIAIGPHFLNFAVFPSVCKAQKTRVPSSSSIASKWIQMATHQDQSMESWDKICGCPSLFLLASLLPGRGFVSICFEMKLCGYGLEIVDPQNIICWKTRCYLIDQKWSKISGFKIDIRIAGPGHKNQHLNFDWS